MSSAIWNDRKRAATSVSQKRAVGTVSLHSTSCVTFRLCLWDVVWLSVTLWLMSAKRKPSQRTTFLCWNHVGTQFKMELKTETSGRPISSVFFYQLRKGRERYRPENASSHQPAIEPLLSRLVKIFLAQKSSMVIEVEMRVAHNKRNNITLNSIHTLRARLDATNPPSNTLNREETTTYPYAMLQWLKTKPFRRSSDRCSFLPSFPYAWESLQLIERCHESSLLKHYILKLLFLFS